jgi:hypothetical protein
MSISEVVRLSPARISLQVQWAKQDNSPGPEIGIFYINQDLVHKVRDLSIVPYHAINSNSSGHIYVLRIPKVRPFSTETRETKQKPKGKQGTMFVVHRKLYGISIAPVGVKPRDHTVIATASGYILAIEPYRSHQNSW